MKRNILRRAAGTVAMAALALTGVAVTAAAPAQAAATCSTQTVTQVNYHKQVFGDYNTVRVDVAATCSDSNNYVAAGTTYVQRSLDGGRSWANVAAESTYSASLVYYSGTSIAPQNAVFRAVYVGGTNGDRTWTSSSSNAVSVAVIRDVDKKWRSVRGGLNYTFKVKSKASIKRIKVKFQRKAGHRWVTYKRIRATSKGVLKGYFKSYAHKTLYRMVLPAKRGFTASKYKFGIIRYGRAIVG